MAGSFLGALTGGAIGSAVVRLVLDSDQYTTQLAAAKGQAATSTAAMGGSFSKFKVAAGAAFAVAGVAVLDFAAQAVQAASNQEEALNKVNVSFGEAADTVTAFAETSAESFGISEASALEAAGGYGVMLQTAGLTADAAADMSVELVGLAADLASFNNIAIEGADGALAKLRSGLAGEAEPLRTMGILLSETRVKAEAYASGIAESGAELTEAQKVQARYNLILKDSTLAQGDFARTSDSLANQQRILAAEIENLKAKLGGTLVPIVSDTVETFGDLAEVLLVVGDLMGKLGNEDTDEAVSGLERIGDTLKTIFTSALPTVIQGAKDAGSNLLDALNGTAALTVEQVESMATATREGASVAVDAFGDLGIATGRFRRTGIRDIEAWTEAMSENFDQAFGDIAHFDTAFALSAKEFRKNAARAAREADQYVRNLRALGELDLDPVFFQALTEDGPDAVNAYVESNRVGRDKIEGYYGDVERAARQAANQGVAIATALDGVPDTKTIDVIVNYTYNGYDANKPIPGTT